MNFPKKTLLASLLMISASSALAVDTLTVTGTIDPPGCDINLGLVTIDYGDITLAESGPTTLPEKTVTYSVDCGAMSTPISLSWEDNRPQATPATTLFGIRALEGGTEIGTYTIEQIELSSKVGNNVSHLRTRDGGGPWGAVPGPNVFVHSQPGHEITHSLDDLYPASGTTFTGEYVVKSTLNEGLNVGNGITLDGQATVTVTRI